MGPMHRTAGFWVVRPASPRLRSSFHSDFTPRENPASAQMIRWVSRVGDPQTVAASRNLTSPFRISTQTGFVALPVITIASQPAYFIMDEKRPPKFERVYQENGHMPVPTPVTSVRPPPEGTGVPQNGEAHTVTTFAGSRPSVMDLSLQ